MADGTLQILGLGTSAVPLEYSVSGDQPLDLLAVNADFNGAAAAVDYVPVVEIVSAAGEVMARGVGSSITAGDSASLTFAPFLGGSSGAACGGKIDSTATAGLVCGVHSAGAAIGDVLTADGANGSIWSPPGGHTAAGYAAQVLAEASLVSYWPCNEASGSLIDYGPAARNLAASLIVYGQPGPFPASADTQILFNGHDGNNLGIIPTVVDLNGGTSPYDFNGTLPFTWECMINPTSYPTLVGPIMSNGAFRGGGSSGGITMALFTSGVLVFYRAGVNLTTTSLITLGVETHVAMVYDGTTRFIYLNGQLDSSSASGAGESTVHPMRFGWQEDTGIGYYTYQGEMAQAAVYSTALSAATILSHAQAAILTPIVNSNIRSVSSNYSISAYDGIVLVTGTTTVTLPTAVGQAGRTLFVKNAGVNTVTVARTSAQTIDGAAANLSMSAKQTHELVSDGSGWWILSN